MNEEEKKNIDSTSLFKNLKSIKIYHNRQIYYLKITKANKLILTK
ncbi:MAG: hemin uptake protein HemP [Arcobacter sp.]